MECEGVAGERELLALFGHFAVGWLDEEHDLVPVDLIRRRLASFANAVDERAVGLKHLDERVIALFHLPRSDDRVGHQTSFIGEFE